MTKHILKSVFKQNRNPHERKSTYHSNTTRPIPVVDYYLSGTGIIDEIMGNRGYQYKIRLCRAARKCKYCGSDMSENERAKTCGSEKCREVNIESRRWPKPTTLCGYCGESFKHFWSSERKYCSYQCHLKSGGAKRAGEAAALVRHTYGAKKDKNHNDLVDAMKKLGVGVIDTSRMGGGFPDLICCVRRETLLVEIKNPDTRYGRRGLNDLQKKFAEEWTGGPVYIVETLDDVELLANYKLDSLYAYGGADQENVEQSIRIVTDV